MPRLLRNHKKGASIYKVGNYYSSSLEFPQLNMKLLLLVVCLVGCAVAAPANKVKRDILPGDERYGTDYHHHHHHHHEGESDVQVTKSVGGYAGTLTSYGPPHYTPGAPLGSQDLHQEAHHHQQQPAQPEVHHHQQQPAQPEVHQHYGQPAQPEVHHHQQQQPAQPEVHQHYGQPAQPEVHHHQQQPEVHHHQQQTAQPEVHAPQVQVQPPSNTYLTPHVEIKAPEYTYVPQPHPHPRPQAIPFQPWRPPQPKCTEDEYCGILEWYEFSRKVTPPTPVTSYGTPVVTEQTYQAPEVHSTPVIPSTSYGVPSSPVVHTQSVARAQEVPTLDETTAAVTTAAPAIGGFQIPSWNQVSQHFQNFQGPDFSQLSQNFQAPNLSGFPQQVFENIATSRPVQAVQDFADTVNQGYQNVVSNLPSFGPTKAVQHHDVHVQAPQQHYAPATESVNVEHQQHQAQATGYPHHAHSGAPTQLIGENGGYVY